VSRIGARMSLLGRTDECAVLDGLIDHVRRGESRSLVLRGEPGIGKTALLKYLVESASDLRVDRAVGVESEMELAFASLHQLCWPMLDRLERLPAPQRQALEIVFGLSAGAAPDRFLVGLAVLSLFSEVADERPLLCVVDDAQWLDQASALTLAFVARRLLAEPVGIVFAAREPVEELQHLPELDVRGLRDGDARALLSSAVRFQLDAQVRDRIIAETRGNPLALLELPQGLTATQLAGGFGLLGAQDLSPRRGNGCGNDRPQQTAANQPFRQRDSALRRQTAAHGSTARANGKEGVAGSSPAEGFGEHWGFGRAAAADVLQSPDWGPFRNHKLTPSPGKKGSPPPSPGESSSRLRVRRSQLEDRKRGQQRGNDRAEQQRAQLAADRYQRDEQPNDGQAPHVGRPGHAPAEEAFAEQVERGPAEQDREADAMDRLVSGGR